VAPPTVIGGKPTRTAQLGAYYVGRVDGGSIYETERRCKKSDETRARGKGDVAGGEALDCCCPNVAGYLLLTKTTGQRRPVTTLATDRRQIWSRLRQYYDDQEKGRRSYDSPRRRKGSDGRERQGPVFSLWDQMQEFSLSSISIIQKEKETRGKKIKNNAGPRRVCVRAGRGIP
jgi:hypothetical protein